jgi:bifunctional non-homologous end joining protein LigD
MAKKVADLAAYRRKRNFSVTTEPRGGRAAGSRLYVIQKHAARRLHYDFRLELDGALKSWAVPKGPSVDPSAKRLAVHVEDHPIEYGSFEGVIPKGEYGGGTVMLWDRGRWEPVGDARSSYRKGRLKFRLHGEKLRGIWNLVRMKGPASEDGKNWLLMKDRDDDAGGEEPTESTEKSVSTRRSMDAIARGREPRRSALKAHRGKAPSGFSPQLATLASRAPEGDDWIHEIKLDGYRILAFVAGGRVRLQSRNGLDWSARFPQVVRAVEKLPMKDAVIDGEVVALRPDGTTDFQELQNIMRSKEPANIAYFAFDLPFTRGTISARCRSPSARACWPGCSPAQARASCDSASIFEATAGTFSSMPAGSGWKGSSPNGPMLPTSRGGAPPGSRSSARVARSSSSPDGRIPAGRGTVSDRSCWPTTTPKDGSSTPERSGPGSTTRSSPAFRGD